MVPLFKFRATGPHFLNDAGRFVPGDQRQCHGNMPQQIAQIGMTEAGVDVPDQRLFFPWRSQLQLFDAVGLVDLPQNRCSDFHNPVSLMVLLYTSRPFKGVLETLIQKIMKRS